MKLTKRDIVIDIVQRTGLTQQEVFDVVQRVLNIVSQSLAKGDRVEFRDFGVFEVKTSKARIGRNPRRPENDVPIPRRAVAKFKMGKSLRERVLKLPTKPIHTKKG